MTTVKALHYTEEYENNQEIIRGMIREGLKDVENGRTKDVDEFFNELEHRYLNE